MTTKIKISEDENTIEVDGKTYIAEQNDTPHCACVCNIGILECMSGKVPCTKRRRKDKHNVIFKEVKK